ncbi:hypothetical protein [Polyangium sp. 15x6]|uniref:hypothetical protein n=1 Tax=Polyangium sp. 15x6 TaxID=3042687 RepID=UPI00249B4378|nr:hypothetical protein [Polyangium sp. 15x6]MDI3287495.1 hypothetical protein [Polyangium sp. 15x6]
MNTKNRASYVAVLAGAALVSTACVAHAAFTRADSSIQEGTYELVVSFQVENLPNSHAIQYNLRTERTTRWGCVDFRDGHWISLPGYTRVYRNNLQKSVVVTTDALGSAEAEVSTDIPQSMLQCPSGTDLMLIEVRYDNIQLRSPYDSAAPAPVRRQILHGI